MVSIDKINDIIIKSILEEEIRQAEQEEEPSIEEKMFGFLYTPLLQRHLKKPEKESTQHSSTED